MQTLTLDQFAARLNESFEVDVADHGPTAFVLVEAKPLSPPAAAGPTRESFSLVFRNASKVMFPQGIYEMRDGLAELFGVFLVPIARADDGYLYEAVFN